MIFKKKVSSLQEHVFIPISNTTIKGIHWNSSIILRSFFNVLDILIDAIAYNTTSKIPITEYKTFETFKPSELEKSLWYYFNSKMLFTLLNCPKNLYNTFNFFFVVEFFYLSNYLDIFWNIGKWRKVLHMIKTPAVFFFSFGLNEKWQLHFFSYRFIFLGSCYSIINIFSLTIIANFPLFRSRVVQL